MKHRVFPLPPIVYPVNKSTLGTALALGSEISIHCNTYGCHHRARLNLVALAGRLGMDHSTLDPALRPHFYCTKCREAGRPDRNFGFSLSPLTGGFSDWPRKRR